MLFTIPYDQHICPYGSSSSVDCTLSLATPATRLTNPNSNSNSNDYHDSPDSPFCWDFLHPGNVVNPSSRPPPSTHKTIHGGATTNPSAVDSFLSRRCANCHTTSTPLWRNGPRGPKSLCNACGIRFKKEERRASVATTTASLGMGVDGAEGYTTWMNKVPSSCYTTVPGGEFRQLRDHEYEVDDRDSTFMTWRLNVTDRPGLLHDHFTRY
ncbi:hypothetical protein QVD17_04959 [Tagetes erecta]|uniref:GATA-type domain-containing protein n=1 Tax=Tagetes erecta TaxID=13708 RepID=A0AAD8PAS8_TARER|nr:hypothetical protein QVD17_04959 [Tagetes erecta]